MFLSKSKLTSLLALILATVSLSACGGTGSSTPTSEPTSEVAATLTFEDLVIKVGDTVPLNPVFDPISAATEVTYTVENPVILTISRSGILTGMAVGSTTVTGTSRTFLSDTFLVTVNENDVIPPTKIELFNENGTFEDVSMPGWSLTGTTADKHVPEVDADRSQEDMSLKLWTGDYNAEDETASLIDFTLTSTFIELFAPGDYTLSFGLVGDVNDISVTLEGQTYSKTTGDVVISGGSYKTSYIEFTLAEEKALALSFTFYSPGTRTNWGFLDDVKLEEGHTKPVDPINEDGNLLKDGSFETTGSKTAYLSTETNSLVDWQFAGTLRTGEEVTLNTWAGHESYSLKYNFWPSAAQAKGDVKVFQHFTLASASTVDLSYIVASGGITDSVIYILVDGVEAYSVAIVNSAAYSTQTLSAISLPAGDVEFGIHIQEGFQTWIHLDYMLLKLAE